MSWVGRAGRQTFRSLEIPNYRRYLGGQVISASGSWIQQIALIWLVVKMTHGNGVAVGTVTALQFTPVLIGGAWAGVLADRLNKRRVLVMTSAGAGIFAGFLGVLVLTDSVQLWMVYALAAAFGAATALDSPTRRSFVTELVPDTHAANAVSLNSAVFTAARVIGPAIGALLIQTAGTGWCFIANAASFLAVIFALLSMDPTTIRRSTPVPRRRGQLREGLHYVRHFPALRTTLLMTAVIGTLAFNFQVTVSLMASKTFHGDAGTFGFMYALMSGGAVVASLVVAHRQDISLRFVVFAALGLGVAMLAATFAPSLPLFGVALVAVGLMSIAFLSASGALAQTWAAPEYRGRVAALFAVAFLGSTPIGGPIVGVVSQVFGPRFGLLLGAVASLAVAGVALRSLHGAPSEAPAPAAAA